jgi:hypothetical protein
MIVNPQSFNYRIAIGTLVLTIAVFAAYSFTSISSAKSKETHLEQEKKILQNELVEIISEYDKINSKNNSLRSELESVSDKAESVLDSLNLLKMNAKSLARFRNQVMFLKAKNEKLLQQEETSSVRYETLLEEKFSIAEELNKKENRNAVLEEENKSLKNSLEEAALIRANSFEAKAFKRRSVHKSTETKDASNADNFEVCFVLAENVIAKKGNRELYVQVIGPDSNIVSDQGAVEFGDSLLIYSSKTMIDFQSKAIDVCVQIDKEETLKKGMYYISIFEGHRRLGGTQIELD